MELTQRGGGEGSSQMRTIVCKGEGSFKVAYVCKNIFFGLQNHKTFFFFFFFTKEAITLPFSIVYRKV